MKGIIITIVIAAILIVLITTYALISQNQTIPSNKQTKENKSAIIITSNTIKTDIIVNNSEDQIPPFQKYYGIDIQDRSFYPQTVKIKKGTVIIWTNQDSMKHTITSDISNSDILLNSPRLSRKDEYRIRFDTIGNYSYHCSVHPYMQGTIIVE